MKCSLAVHGAAAQQRITGVADKDGQREKQR